MTEPQLEPEKLDPEIRPIIIELNKLGYKTLFSCAGGHKEVPVWEQDRRGYITVVGKHRIKTLCKKLGLKRIKEDSSLRLGLKGCTTLTFTGLGGLSYHFNLSGFQWNREWIHRPPRIEEIS